jgi:hypothetical protein
MRRSRKTSIRRLFPHMIHVLVAKIAFRAISSAAAARYARRYPHPLNI